MMNDGFSKGKERTQESNCQDISLTTKDVASVRVWMVTIVCSLASAMTSAHMFALSMIIDELSAETHLTLNEQGFLNTAILLGMLFGSLAGGVFADIYGTRIVNIVSATACIVFGAAQSFSSDFVALFVIRLVLGIGNGALKTAIWPMVAKYAPENRKTLHIGIVAEAFNLGAIYAPALAWIFVDTWGWRVFMMVLSLTNILTFLGMYFGVPPDSPKFRVDQQLLVQDIGYRYDNMESQGIASWYPDNIVSPQMCYAYEYKCCSNEMEVDDDYEYILIDNYNKCNLASQQHAIQVQEENEPILKPQLTSTTNISYVQQSQEGLQNVMSEMYAWTSINFWMPPIFEKFGNNLSNIYVQTVIVNLIASLGTIGSLFLVDSVGRVRLLSFSQLGCGIVLFVVLMLPQTLTNFLVIFGVSMFMNSMMWVPLSLVPTEVYSPDISGAAFGIGTAASFAGAIVFTYVAPYFLILSTMGPVIVSASGFLLASLFILLVPETKQEKKQSRPSQETEPLLG